MNRIGNGILLLGVDCAMFLDSFNYFRGIAILFIVTGHTYYISRWYADERWERFLTNLASGGTILFVFISGFLFHHVFYHRFRYKDFVLKKLKNVLVPYLVLSAIPITIYLINQNGPFDYFFFNREAGIWNQYIRPAILYYWVGGAQSPYWYIPFIILTFLLSPLHAKYIELNTTAQSIILFFLTALSIFMHRPPNNLYPIHALFYYASSYFLGIYCSIYRENIYRILKGKEVFLIIPVLGLAAYQAWKFPGITLFAKPALEVTVPDLMLIQKMVLCLFFMVFFHRFEDRRIKVLDHMAKASFAVYFLHGFVIRGTGTAIKKLGFNFTGNVMTWVVFTIAVAFIAYWLAVLLKKILGNKSRYIIGW